MRLRISRRAALGALGAFGAGFVGQTAFASDKPASGAAVPKSHGQGPTLGEIAARAGLLFGAAIGHEAFEDPAYGQLYASEARIVTTDNALKFGALRPDQDTFSFDRADRIMAFAAAHRIQVRGHNLAWNENLPDWLKTLSAREATAVFDRHIDTVVARYAGRLHSWDVVNEPFWPGHHQPGGYRNGPWLAAMGPGYIERALRRAYAIDKTARLTVNEAHCEILDGWGAGIRPRLLDLVDRLRQSGAPLHAVGLQGHLQPQWSYDDDAFLEFVSALAERDVDIYITELDVNDTAFDDDPERRDAQVAQRYASFLGHVLRVPRVKLVATWQLADVYSWYRDIPGEVRGKRRPRPLLFGPELQRTPAWGAAAEAFRGVCGVSSTCGDRGERLVTN